MTLKNNLKNPLLETFSQSAARRPQDINGTDEADTLIGTRHNDNIHAYAGDDTIWGRRGNDTIYSDRGSNEVYGGKGDDRLSAYYSYKKDENYLFGGAGDDIISAGDTHFTGDPGKGFYYIKGGKGDDFLAARDTTEDWDLKTELYGGAGSDEFFIWGGSSTMYGGWGDDKLHSANGAATITGGAGADVFKLYRTSDDVTITDFVSGEDRIRFDYDAEISLSDLLIEADGDDVTITRPTGEQIRLLGLSTDGFGLKDITGLNLLGTLGDDILEGSRFKEHIHSYGGDDYISGGGRNDVIYAYAGNNTVYGDGGHDLIYGGSDNDTIFGGNGNDFLISAAGNNTLYGGERDDYIVVLKKGGTNQAYGGEGDDDFEVYGSVATVYGGGGNDVTRAWAATSILVYDGDVDEGVDRVFNFNTATDKLRISEAVFLDLVIQEITDGTVITLPGGTEITLTLVQPDEVTQDIFDFV